MRRLLSRAAAWVVYKTFIYFSRHVSYPDFRIIWEQAYQASVEAEWQRMRMLNRGMGIMGMSPSPSSSTSTKSMLVEQAAGVGQMQNAPQSEPTSPKLASTAGQEGNQPPTPPSNPPSKGRKAKGA